MEQRRGAGGVMRRAGLAAGLALSLILPASAQERPAIRPTRDVDVTYRVPAGGKVLHERMRWLVAPGLLRVDPPGGSLYMIVNYARHRMWLVEDATRRYREMEARGTELPGGAPQAPFTKMGPDTVAGIPCTEWGTVDSRRQPVLVCLTADGVMLRAATETHGASRTLIEAEQVRYGPQDPALFRVPDSYTRVEPQAGGK